MNKYPKRKTTRINYPAASCGELNSKEIKKIVAREGLISLFIGIILAGGWWVSHGQIFADTKELIISTDKIEYYQGETAKVVVKNNLNEPIFLESCNPVIIGLKDKQNIWKEINRKFCFVNLVKQQINSGKDKIITEFVWEGFPIGTYRLKFTYCLGCTKDCVKESVEESNYCIRCIIKKTSRHASKELIDKPIILGLQFCDKCETIYSEEFTIKQKSDVVVDIDKTEYEQGETVKMTIINGLTDEITIPYKGKELYGNFAKVERKNRLDEWEEIELPVIKTKLMYKKLKPGEKHIYSWKHQITGDNYSIANPGTYRIKLSYSKRNWRDGVIVYSNEFKIKKKQNEVTIATDKIEYGHGKTVKITIRNNLNIPLRNCDMATKDIFFCNQSLAWGFIERFENGDWVKIEPLWRCGDVCFAMCKLNGSFFVLGEKGATKFPKDFRSFEWDQTCLICDPKRGRTIDSELVGSGRYRISSTFWDESKKRDIKRTFYSNEFIIK